MIRGFGAWTACLALALCAACRPHREPQPTTRQLYPFQKELEAKLKGTPEERKRLAALLPLMLRIRTNWDRLKLMSLIPGSETRNTITANA